MEDYFERANTALEKLFSYCGCFVRTDKLADYCGYDRTIRETVENFLKSNCSAIGWTGETPYGDYDSGYFFDNPTVEQTTTYCLVSVSEKTFPFRFEQKSVEKNLGKALARGTLANAEVFPLGNGLTLAVTDSHIWMLRQITFEGKSRI